MWGLKFLELDLNLEFWVQGFQGLGLFLLFPATHCRNILDWNAVWGCVCAYNVHHGLDYWGIKDSGAKCSE